MLNYFLLGIGDVYFPARRALCFGEPGGDAAPVSHLEKELELQTNIDGSRNPQGGI